jgi:hypothetical protein
MSHECQYCGKSYSKKIYFTRHVVLCEYSRKTKEQRKSEDEEYEFSNPEDSKITMKKLYNIVLELAYQNKKLEKKVEDMQNHLNMKKKFNICKWLQDTHNQYNLHNDETQIPVFKSWIKTIQVTEEETDILQEENMFQTICSIFDKNIHKQDKQHKQQYQQDDQPIKCFTQKANVFFIFTENISENQTVHSREWKRMEMSEFLLLLKYIHQKLVKAMCDWFKKNQPNLNETQTITYNVGVNKLMNAEFQKETALVSKLRVYLYNKIKTEIPSEVLEREFE